MHDLRYALRMFLKAPGFTAVAVLALALGIGANTAIFTVVNAVLLRPLPFPGSERLVYMNEESSNLRGMSVSYLNLRDWQAQNHVFEGIAGTQPAGVTLTTNGPPELVEARNVSHEFWSVLGVKPTLGRVFVANEDQPGATPVAVLSYGSWQRRFGGDPAILGRAINLSGKSYTVIGVMPKTFLYRAAQDEIFMPLGLQADEMKERGNHPGIYALARMKPGVTLEQARAEMKTIAARLAQQYSDSNATNTVLVRRYSEVVTGDARDSLLALFGAVAFVLLIACANVANLLLARAGARQKEIAIRMAVGARRSRLVRQLLTESVLLALAGGGLGLLLASWGVALLVKAAPDSLPRILEIKVDTPVLLFTLGAAVLTGILFGLAPALSTSSPRLNETLKEGGRNPTGGRQRLRSVLVVSEVALSLVLLLGAGLLIRSFARLRAVDPGINTEHVLTARLILPEQRYPSLRFVKDHFEGDDSRTRSFFEQLYAKLSSLPGVKSAGTITPLPLSGEGWQTDYYVPGTPRPSVGEFPNTDIHYVSPGYLATMQVPLLRGRNFTEADRDRRNPVVMVNETFAKRWWPGQDPLGQHIRMNAGHDARNENDEMNPLVTVVGVVGDVKQYGLDTQAKTEVYIPMLQAPRLYTFLVVRTEGDPLAIANAVRESVASLDKDLPLATVQTMDDVLESSIASRKLSVALLAAFAALALLLAIVGIYGVMSYSVTQRTHEIGIRMALGAARSQVLSMVMQQAFRLVLIGMAAGVLLSFGAARLLRSMLFGVRPSDPMTMVAIIGVLAMAGVLASAAPALRATKVDPMIALRYE
jgi:putative ABC transport system permease protein